MSWLWCCCCYCCCCCLFGVFFVVVSTAVVSNNSSHVQFVLFGFVNFLFILVLLLLLLLLLFVWVFSSLSSVYTRNPVSTKKINRHFKEMWNWRLLPPTSEPRIASINNKKCIFTFEKMADVWASKNCRHSSQKTEERTKKGNKDKYT